MSTTHDKAQQSKPETTPQQSPEQMTEQDSPLFSGSTLARPTPSRVLQMQRLFGNSRTSQMLGSQAQAAPAILQRTSSRIQREDSKLGGGLSLTGAKVTRDKVFHKKERSFGYVTAAIEISGGATIEVKWDKAIQKATGSSVPGDVGAEGKSDGNSSEAQLKVKAELWKDKTAQSAEEKDDILGALHDHIEVTKAELEFTAPKSSTDTKKDEQKSSMGVALVISTAAGDKHKLFLNVFESKVTGEETVVKGPHGGLEFEINLLPKCWSTIASQLGVSLSGSLTGKAKVTFSPNWTAIAAEAAKRYGAPVLARILGGSGAGIGMVGMGLIGGGIATIQGYYEFIQQMAELKELRRMARSAPPGYVAGFMQGIGVSGKGSGEAGWFAYGVQRGKAAFDAQVQAMRKYINETYPEQAQEVTDEMLIEAMKARIAASSQQLTEQLYGAAEARIRVLLYRKFMETHPDQKDYIVRGYANLAPYGELVDPFKEEMPAAPGAGGDAQSGGDPGSQEMVDDPYEDPVAQQPQAGGKAPAQPAPKKQVTKQELEHEDKNRMDQHTRDKAQENQQAEQAKQDYNDQAALAAQSMYWADDYKPES